MQHRTVVTYPARGAEDEHQQATRAAIARALAALLGWEFGGAYDPAAPFSSQLYFVPGDTLLASEATALGIHGFKDLFGGVVPFPFVATKSIAHPLVGPKAQAPEGWLHAFAERVRMAVLPGYAAFTVEDVRRGALQLLRRGPVRLKPGQGVGGHGQTIVADPCTLTTALEQLDRSRLPRFGVVIELDLSEAATFSIGQVRAAGLRASYCGRQFRTTDNRGGDVYGGSALQVVRGGYEALARLALEPAMRKALEQARCFDRASADFSGFFASRRNYDVLHGRDREGRWHCGVLEQSWRIGGASGAEIAALAAFLADPRLCAVNARCIEAYGRASVPPHAIVHYSDFDRRIGLLTKYTELEAYEVPA